MTLRELCDATYALLVRKIEAQNLNDRIVVAIRGGDLPTIEAAREKFDTALNAEPEVVNTEQLDLLRGLGLRR